MLKSRGVLNGYLITLLLQGKFGLVWWGQTIKGILELDEGKTVDLLLGKQGVVQLGLIIAIFLWYSWRC